MSHADPTLEVYRGDVLLAVLSHIELFDWPWYRCDFHPTSEFEQYKPLFDDELQLLERDGATEEWLLAYGKIEDLQLTLTDPQAAKTTEVFGLHVESTRARFKVHFGA